MEYKLNWFASDGTIQSVTFSNKQEALASEAYKILKLATRVWFSVQLDA